MGRDEQQAFDYLQKNWDLQKPVIEAYNGRLLKEVGDGILASFSTPSESVNAAISIQEKVMKEKYFQLRIQIYNL